MCEDEDADLSYQEMLSFYGYQNSDPFSDCESEDKASDKEEPCEGLNLEQQAEDTSSQMPSFMPSGGSPSLSPCSADSPEHWVLEPVLEEEEIIGSQAQLPYLQYTPAEEREFDERDNLLWDPNVLPENEVESFLNRAAEYQQRNAHGLRRGRAIARDNEQALYELVKCSFNVEEALRRLYFNVKAVKGGLFAWSEDERRNFEQGFRVYGKNFHLIQANKMTQGVINTLRFIFYTTTSVGHKKVRTRSVGECVQYYYSWKKSKRFKLFEKSRQGRRKHGIPSVECEYDAVTSENPFRLQESNCCGQNFGSSGIQNSIRTDCSSSRDQCTCRLSPVSGQASENSKEASLLNLDFPTQELPVMSDLMGLDLPLSTFTMTNVTLPDFLRTPSRLCTAPLAP